MSMTESQYAAKLDSIIDEIFNIAATDHDWSWPVLAERAGLCYATVYRLGTYTTRLPRLQTILKLSKAVGMTLIMVRAKDSAKILRLVG